MFGSTLRRRTRLDVNCIASCNFIITDPHAKSHQDPCTRALTDDFIMGGGHRWSTQIFKDDFKNAHLRQVCQKLWNFPNDLIWISVYNRLPEIERRSFKYQFECASDPSGCVSLWTGDIKKSKDSISLHVMSDMSFNYYAHIMRIEFLVKIRTNWR